MSGYYSHVSDLVRGYLKDPGQRDTQLALIGGWQSEVDRLQVELGIPVSV